MNIVCATDNSFVQHCTVMLVSVLCNNKDADIYVLTEGLTPENEHILREEIERFGGNLHICYVEDERINALPLSSSNRLNHISKATYYRLFIPDLLPDVNKVIYFDCDIIVNGSLAELWEIDITDYAIAAVLQIGHGFEAERLGYPIEYGYFNAGVCVYNLKYFRDNGIKDVLFQYAENNIESIRYNDQDILNAVLYDKCLHLLPMWNMTSMAYDPFLRTRGDTQNGRIINDYKVEKDNIMLNKATPVVLHYVSKPKPWQKGCYHPLSALYYYYARKTVFYNKIRQEVAFLRVLAMWKYRIRCSISSIKQSIIKSDNSRL